MQGYFKRGYKLSLLFCPKFQYIALRLQEKPANICGYTALFIYKCTFHQNGYIIFVK